MIYDSECYFPNTQNSFVLAISRLDFWREKREEKVQKHGN